ncbi:MAG: hypothetical protein V4692_09845, partial [Bdellovibrionota bacterium]
MKKILIPLLLVVMTGCASANVNRAPARDHTEQTKITLTGSLEPNEMPFVSHTGPGAFDNALALNVPNDPIKGLRGSIEQV